MNKERMERIAWFVWMLCLFIIALPAMVYAIYTMIEIMIATPTFNVIATFSLLIAFMVLVIVGIVALFIMKYKHIKSDK